MAAVLMTGAGAASAHTVFEGSDPPDGATLSTGPRTVSLDFTSDVDLSLARVQLVDGAGHRLTAGVLSVDPTRPTRLLVPMPALPAETYRLSFSVRDSVDLHVTESSIVFGVGRVTSLKAARPPSRGPDPAEVVLRWVARSGLALVLGALAVSQLVVPAALGAVRMGRQIQRRLLTLAMIGVAIATAGDTALLGLQASQIGPLRSTFSRLLTGSGFGRRWMIGVQLSVGLVLVLGWLRRQPAGPQTAGGEGRGRFTSRYAKHLIPALAGLLAAAEAVAVGVSGHTGASATPTATGVALRGAHLVAVGAWVGGLLALAAAALPVRDQLEDQLSGPATRIALLRRFSPVAAGGLVAVVVTGLLLSGNQVATVTALLTTWYGLILVVKVVLVGLVAALGMRHARLLRSPRADPGPGETLAPHAAARNRRRSAADRARRRSWRNGARPGSPVRTQAGPEPVHPHRHVRRPDPPGFPPAQPARSQPVSSRCPQHPAASVRAHPNRHGDNSPPGPVGGPGGLDSGPGRRDGIAHPGLALGWRSGQPDARPVDRKRFGAPT
jgi:copper transport protein